MRVIDAGEERMIMKLACLVERDGQAAMGRGRPAGRGALRRPLPLRLQRPLAALQLRRHRLETDADAHVSPGRLALGADQRAGSRLPEGPRGGPGRPGSPGEGRPGRPGRIAPAAGRRPDRRRRLQHPRERPAGPAGRVPDSLAGASRPRESNHRRKTTMEHEPAARRRKPTTRCWSCWTACSTRAWCWPAT